MYREIRPSPLLVEFIQNFWRIRTSNSADSESTEVLPDGCFDIVVYIRKKRENEVYLTGIWERPVTVSTPANSSVVGARFYPPALDLFLKIGIAELKNISQPFPLELAYTIKDMSLAYLYNCKDPEEIIRYLNIYLSLLLESRRNLHNRFLHSLLNSDTNKPITVLSRELGLSDRHLNRKFSQLFGLPPKAYMNILRFIKAQDLLKAGTGESLAHIAAEAGYYDQAHFTREFKKYSGKTPRQYLAENV